MFFQNAIGLFVEIQYSFGVVYLNMIIEVMYDLRFLRFRNMEGVPIPIPDPRVLFSMPIILDDSHRKESLRIEVLCIV